MQHCWRFHPCFVYHSYRILHSSVVQWVERLTYWSISYLPTSGGAGNVTNSLPLSADVRQTEDPNVPFSFDWLKKWKCRVYTVWIFRSYLRKLMGRKWARHATKREAKLCKHSDGNEIKSWYGIWGIIWSRLVVCAGLERSICPE